MQQVPALLPPSLSPLSKPSTRSSAALNVVRTQCLPLSDSDESDDDEVGDVLGQPFCKNWQL